MSSSRAFTIVLLCLVVSISGCVGFYRWLQSLDPSDELLLRERVEQSLVLIQNTDSIIPIKNLSNKRITLLSLSKRPLVTFGESLNLYKSVRPVWISEETSTDSAAVQLVKDAIQDTDLLILGLTPSYNAAQEAILSSQTLRILRWLAQTDSVPAVILNYFGDLTVFERQAVPLSGFKGVLVAPTQDTLHQNLAAQLLFGGIAAKGRLQTTLAPQFPEGFGLDTPPPTRLKYTIPEEIGIARERLLVIDTIVAEALRQEATPGCQVLVARNGKVFFHKAYGYHTYAQTQKVRLTDLYDLASVTKITSALPALMQWHGQGKFSTDKTLGDYIPELEKTNKAHLPIDRVLAHQARLQSYFIYWQEDQKADKLAPYLSSVKTDDFRLAVTDSLFIKPEYYQERILKRIADSRLRRNQEYKYSGLAFLLWPKLIERLSKQRYEEHLQNTFYQPLGAETLTFLPRRYFPKEQIVPTELDEGFRKQLLHGYVHDDAASMLGGLSANAGLFSNANDLAKLLQMYLWGGEYGGERFISAASIDFFTKRHFAKENNRRGLGFDKPLIKGASINGNAAPSASPRSYGHSGYTGTFAWVDPAYGLVYVFLSNRVHPTRKNTKLFKLNTRTRIQEAIYEAIED